MGEFMSMPMKKSIYVPLKLNKMDLEDAIFNPFSQDSHSEYYMSTDINLDQDELPLMPEKFFEDIEKGKIESYNDMMGFETRFALTGYMNVQIRTRYTIWNLISDVGGFNDGIFLCFAILMGRYSSAAFDVSYINSTYVDRGISASDLSRQGKPKKVHPYNQHKRSQLEEDPPENLFPNLDRG